MCVCVCVRKFILESVCVCVNRNMCKPLAAFSFVLLSVEKDDTLFSHT